MKFSSRDRIYFDMFVEASEIILKTAELLQELMTNYENVNEKIKKIEEKEHECDLHIHIILDTLNKTFITPIDREDINMIARELDDITDAIESTAHRFRMFNVTSIREDALKLSSLIVDCASELKVLMKELSNIKKSKKIMSSIIEINRIENVGDDIYRNAISNLFCCETDALEVLRWKEIYEYLETSLDACEDVANSVEGVIMKNS
ncbi:MAG: DUF47 family protein [Clostridiales bacterium]|nr:DUF47 family protein [Clostridiales bacterium]